MRTVLVVATTFRHFFLYAMRLPHKELKIDSRDRTAYIDGIAYEYCEYPGDMLGYKGVVTEFWGPVDDMPDIEEFRANARMARLGL